MRSPNTSRRVPRPWTCRDAALRLLAVGGVMVGAGCATTPKIKNKPLFFPAPPAEPRIQFLTWASGADQLEDQRGAFESFILGEEQVVRRAINKPYGVAVRDGAAYVCDTKGLSLCKLDFKNRRFSQLGMSGPGRLKKPINVAIDSLGYKFVVDTNRKQVVVFGPDDEYVKAHNVPEPCRPVDLAIRGNELYVLDNDESPQIVVMDRTDGRVLRTLGSGGGEPGQFRIPNSLALDESGNLYVSDTHNWRVQKLAPDGTPIWTKGTPGYQLGQFGRPRGVRLGPDGILYVVDGATEIVQMFDADGNTLMRFGGPGDQPGALGLPSSLAIDADSIPYFKQYIHKDFKVEYLLFVISQYGPRLVNVYAFGSFPQGYSPSEREIQTIEPLPIREGIGPVEGEDLEPKPSRSSESAGDAAEKEEAG